jgi:hypothetical protein
METLQALFDLANHEKSFSCSGWLRLLPGRYNFTVGSITPCEIVPLQHIPTVSGNPLQKHIGGKRSPKRC